MPNAPKCDPPPRGLVRSTLKRPAGSVPNAEDDNPRLVRSVENYIGLWPHYSAANIALVGEAPGVRVIRK
jgi:hypothetical protein